MASDRFIYFDNRVPTQDEIETILNNFFNGVGQIARDGRRWTVLLPGKPKAALTGIKGAHPSEPRDDERWLEVFLGQDPPNVDVITRVQDEFVSALADGLVKLFAWFYKGRVEEDY